MFGLATGKSARVHDERGRYRPAPFKSPTLFCRNGSRVPAAPCALQAPYHLTGTCAAPDEQYRESGFHNGPFRQIDLILDCARISPFLPIYSWGEGEDEGNEFIQVAKMGFKRWLYLVLLGSLVAAGYTIFYICCKQSLDRLFEVFYKNPKQVFFPRCYFFISASDGSIAVLSK